MPTYTWLTKTGAVAALQGRLSNAQFWSPAELWLYLSEGLRIFNALCEQWNVDLSISPTNGQWINTGTLTGSPRLRTVTDQYLYNQMAQMLLEPTLTSGTWAGTTQFNLSQLQFSLQKRVQEVIQASSCNISQLAPLNATPGVRRNQLPDTVLEQRRTRFLGVVTTTTGTASSGASVVAVASAQGAVQGQVMLAAGIQPGAFITGVSGLNISISLPTIAALANAQVQFAQPITLTREDTEAFQSFQPSYLQDFGLPQSWSVASEPPLGFDTDLAPSVPGTFDILALNAAATFAPPSATLLGIPDDWSWLPMYGALADVLGIESEATDRSRAAYCLQRYTEGLELMKQSNWLLKTTINGQVAKATALAEMDGFGNGWQESYWFLPSVVEAGIDMLAPTPGVGLAVGVTLLGNAPLLDTTGVYVQVARDDFEAVLNYAQTVAAFKEGGAEFEATLPLLQDFYRAVGARNKRWLNSSTYVDILREQGRLEEIAVPK